MNKQQLANKIWASANRMRSRIDANEYKDYILGLVFYRFLSDNEVNHILKGMKGASDEDKKAALESLVENYEDEISGSACPPFLVMPKADQILRQSILDSEARERILLAWIHDEITRKNND